MRLLLAFLIGVVTAAIVAGLAILVVQNNQRELLLFLGTTVQLSQGRIVATASTVGFLIAVLLLFPGWLASARRSYLLGRQAHLQETHLQALREDYARLRGGHQRLVEEHQRVMDQVLTPIAVGNGRSPTPPPAASSQPAGTPPGADDGHRATVAAT